MKEGFGKIADYVVTDKGWFDTHFVKRRFTLQFAYPRVRLVNRCNFSYLSHICLELWGNPKKNLLKLELFKGMFCNFLSWSADLFGRLQAMTKSAHGFVQPVSFKHCMLRIHWILCKAVSVWCSFVASTSVPIRDSYFLPWDRSVTSQPIGSQQNNTVALTNEKQGTDRSYRRFPASCLQSSPISSHGRMVIC